MYNIHLYCIVRAEVNCEVVGERIPPPFVVDVSNLHLEEPFGKITLGDMLHLLPSDGTVRFGRDYSSRPAASYMVLGLVSWSSVVFSGLFAWISSFLT